MKISFIALFIACSICGQVQAQSLLECSVPSGFTVRYDTIRLQYEPETFDASFTLTNLRNSDITGLTAVLDLRDSPHLETVPGVPDTLVLDSLHTGASYEFTWKLRPGNTTEDELQNPRILFRCDQDTVWRYCGYGVMIEDGSWLPPKAYCFSVRAVVPENVWMDSVSKTLSPEIMQAGIWVINTCEGTLTNVEVHCMLPPSFNPVFPLKKMRIDKLAPGDSVFFSLDLKLQLRTRSDTLCITFVAKSDQYLYPGGICSKVFFSLQDSTPLTASKMVLWFEAERNAGLPAADSVLVYGGHPQSASWSVANAHGWLAATPGQGNGDAAIAVQPTTTDLAPGLYERTVSIISTASGSPHNVLVYYRVNAAILGVPANPAASGLTLHANYPNPFTGSTSISYTVPTAQPVTLTVYNTLGQPVQALQREAQSGTNTVQLTDMNPGMYMVVLHSKSGAVTRRMVSVEQ